MARPEAQPDRFRGSQPLYCDYILSDRPRPPRINGSNGKPRRIATSKDFRAFRRPPNSPNRHTERGSDRPVRRAAERQDQFDWPTFGLRSASCSAVLVSPWESSPFFFLGHDSLSESLMPSTVPLTTPLAAFAAVSSACFLTPSPTPLKFVVVPWATTSSREWNLRSGPADRTLTVSATPPCE